MTSRPATLYDAVHTALLALADRLPGEPPVLLAWGPEALAAKVTDHVEASGLLIGGPSRVIDVVPNLVELTEDERRALPARFHRPVFDNLGSPASWLCGVCWGDGIVSAWPCRPAIAGGLELADAIGAEASR